MPTYDPVSICPCPYVLRVRIVARVPHERKDGWHLGRWIVKMGGISAVGAQC
jgi:hypothetical protein